MRRSASRLALDQAAEARQTLLVHGAEAAEKNGYQSLKKISRGNREKIIPRSIRLPRKLSDFERAIDGLRLVFTHCTNNRSYLQSLIGRERQPLLSARQLGFGAHVNNAYNRDFLLSDNHVFFTVSFQRRSDPVRGHKTHYGSIPIVLNEGYAYRYGLISVFNMYPNDLLSASSRLPALRPYAFHLSKKLPFRRSDVSSPKWLRLRENLWKFLYTPPDFEYVLKNKLKQFVLQRFAAHKNPARKIAFLPTEGEKNMESKLGLRPILYDERQVLSVLTRGSSEDIWRLIYEIFRYEYDFSIYVELRVPVAVPADRLSIPDYSNRA